MKIVPAGAFAMLALVYFTESFTVDTSVLMVMGSILVIAGYATLARDYTLDNNNHETPCRWSGHAFLSTFFVTSLLLPVQPDTQWYDRIAAAAYSGLLLSCILKARWKSSKVFSDAGLVLYYIASAQRAWLNAHHGAWGAITLIQGVARIVIAGSYAFEAYNESNR